MSDRARILSRAALTVLAAITLVVVWIGLRSRPSAARPGHPAPLLQPRFEQPPRLSLGVLDAGTIPPALREAWAAAAPDGRFDLARLRGVPAVVNFWASWCDPCRREAPLLERAWQVNRGRVLLLGVNQNDKRGDALDFMRKFGITYPIVREPADRTSIRWGVGGLPITFFISADGRVVAQTIGQLRPGQLERGIRAARRGRL